MERDWASVIAALRAKANDAAVTPQEAKALNDKADELESKYKPTQRFVYIDSLPPLFAANVTVTVVTKDGNNFGAWLVDIVDEGDFNMEFPQEEGIG